MKNKKLLYLLLGVAILGVVLLIIFTPKLNTDFDHVEVPRTYSIINKTDLDYIDKVATVGLLEMGLDTIYLQIYPMGDETVSKSKDDVDIVGRVISDKEGTSSYIMQIDTKMSVRDIIKTIAHEIIHIEQHESGKLIKHRDENGTITGIVTWDGWPHYDIFKMNYEDFPWEKDAYKRDDALYDKMMEELFGSVDKLMR